MILMFSLLMEFHVLRVSERSTTTVQLTDERFVSLLDNRQKTNKRLVVSVNKAYHI